MFQSPKGDNNSEVHVGSRAKTAFYSKDLIILKIEAKNAEKLNVVFYVFVQFWNVFQFKAKVVFAPTTLFSFLSPENVIYRNLDNVLYFHLLVALLNKDIL